MHAHRSFRAPVLTTLRAASFAALIAAPFATPAAPALPLAASPTPVVAAATPASAKRAPTHEDVWLLKRVGAPSVSPDGRWAAFSVVEPAYDRKDQRSDLWLVAVDGGTPPRRLTNTAAGESGVAWSPDGKKLAFSSKREGDSDEQIYVLDLAGGGEALRVTNAPLGARTPKFSPDGTRILYVADAWPGAKDDADNRRLDKERKDRKYDVRVYETFPIRNWDKWLDERQARVYVQSLEPGASAKDLLAGSQLLQQKGYAGRTEDDGIKLDPVWAPDGKGIVFVASVDRDRAARAFTSNELWYVSADGGEPRALTSGADSWGEPKFSADGRTLYAEWSPSRKAVYVSTRIAAFDWTGDATSGASRNLTAALDRSATSWGVSSNGTVWYLAEDAGHEKLHVIEPGKPARLAFDVPVGVYTGLAVAPTSAEPVLVARWESVSNPPQVVRVDPAKGHVALTSFDADKVAALDLPPVEHFTFRAKATGRTIHNLVVRPPGFDPAKKYPLFVMIHGGPANMWRDQFFLRWNYHLIASGSGASTPGASRDGYVLVLTNYTGSTGFGEKFAQSIQNDPLKGPGAEVNEAADVAIAKYPFIDGSRQCAGGASYGGHLSNWMQASTTRYRCLVSHAGLIDLASQWGTSDAVYHREVMVGGPPWENGPLWKSQSPRTYAAKFRTPVLVTIGERDFRVPLNNTLEYWTILQRQQVPARLVVYPGENHWIQNGENSKVFYRDIADWLAKYLQPGGAKP
jgi:dipeptidyl aminopeptidase/acylaminoacyl peptidase